MDQSQPEATGSIAQPGVAPFTVLQVGPSLDARGGVASVERLIARGLRPTVGTGHIATISDRSLAGAVAAFPFVLARLRRRLHGADPVVVHVHFASRGSLLRKLMVAQVVLRSGAPLVMHAHGGGFDSNFEQLPGFAQKVVTATLRRADRLIVLSRRWQEFYCRRCSVDPERVVVLPNAVSLPATAPERSGRQGGVQFLYLGRLSEQKGAFDLVRAFSGLDPALRCRLVMAGDGEVEVARTMARSSPSAIEVLPWVDEHRRDQLLAASDVFVLPSHAEGLPLALLEAMAWGLPSIVSPVGGIPDVVRDGHEAVFVAPGNVSQLRDALHSLASTEGVRTGMGARARASAMAFGESPYLETLMRTYTEILVERRRLPAPVQRVT